MNSDTVTITIRKADVSYSAQIAEIEKQCFSVPWSEKSVSDFLEQPSNICFSAEIDGCIAGYVGMMVMFNEGNITNVAVSPAFRRLGVGSALITHLINYSQNENIEKIMLEVRASNLIAQKLYKKHGFAEVGRRKNFYSKPTEDALLMDYIFSDRN